MLYSDKNGSYRYIVNDEKYNQVMKFLFIHIFGEKKRNSKMELQANNFIPVLTDNELEAINDEVVTPTPVANGEYGFGDIPDK